jgi:hypothetical protein
MTDDTDPEEIQPDSKKYSKIDSPNLVSRWWFGGIALMCVLACGWISYQSFRYFRNPEVVAGRKIAEGGIDLHNRYRETRSWFRGEPVYRMYGDAVYAPASYAIFGVLFNVLNWHQVKILWYAASLACTALLSWQLVHMSLARNIVEKCFIGIMPFSFYSVGAALGNGQLVLIVLPLVLNSLLLLTRSVLSLWQVGLGVAMMTLALVQPTIAAPFFWLVIFRSPRILASSLVVGLYGLLTSIATMFQMYAFPIPRNAGAPMMIVERWTRRAQGGTHVGSVRGGYGTVHDLTAYLGWKSLNLWVSLALLGLLGIWVYRNRRSDFWLTLGVTALVARMWMYHRWYDDLLIVFPMVALFRLSRSSSQEDSARRIALGLFFTLWGFSLAPGILYTLPNPSLLVGVQVASWIASLLFLIWVVRSEQMRGCHDLPSKP